MTHSVIADVCNLHIKELNCAFVAVRGLPKRNHLKLYAKKTTVFWSEFRRSVVLGSDVIDTVDIVRNLDLIVDQCLTFDQHVLPKLGTGLDK